MSFVKKNIYVLFRRTSGRIILIISEVKSEDVCRELKRAFDVQKSTILVLINQACHRPREQIPQTDGEIDKKRLKVAFRNFTSGHENYFVPHR